MKHLSRIEITTPGIPGRGPTSVLLDGHDITRSVVAHQISAGVGRITEVHLTLHVADTSSHGAAAVYLDPSTAALLQRHGWTPPDGNELLLPSHECELEQLRTEVERLKVERDEALTWSPWNDHDVLFEKWAQRRAEGGAPPEHECVPTQDAYDRACAALWKHRGRADALAAAISEVATVAEQVGYSVPETAHVKSALLGVATKLRDALRVDEAALRDLPHPDRAPGGPVSSGQTVTIGPAELPPLPKRVKGTHGPTPAATTCSSCGQPTLPNGRCYNRDRCPQSAVIR